MVEKRKCDYKLFYLWDKSKRSSDVTQGEMGVSLKKKIFFKKTHFHSVTTQMLSLVRIYYHCIVFLLPLMAIVCVMANLLLN